MSDDRTAVQHEIDKSLTPERLAVHQENRRIHASPAPLDAERVERVVAYALADADGVDWDDALLATRDRYRRLARAAGLRIEVVRREALAEELGRARAALAADRHPAEEALRRVIALVADWLDHLADFAAEGRGAAWREVENMAAELSAALAPQADR